MKYKCYTILLHFSYSGIFYECKLLLKNGKNLKIQPVRN